MRHCVGRPTIAFVMISLVVLKLCCTPGGASWAAFNAVDETIDIAADKLTQATVRAQLQSIAVEFDDTPGKDVPGGFNDA